MNTNAVTKVSALTLIAVVISLEMLGSATGQDAKESPLDTATPKQVGSAAEIWEYKVSELVYKNELEAALNKLGAEGWELVHIHDKAIAVFKRKKPMSAMTPDSHVPVNQSVWHGDWDTDWGPMTISVASDGSAIGTYGVAKHKIAGSVNPETPNVLSGRWSHSDSNLAGKFRFEIFQENQFKGYWTHGAEVLKVDLPNWVGKKTSLSSKSL